MLYISYKDISKFLYLLNINVISVSKIDFSNTTQKMFTKNSLKNTGHGKTITERVLLVWLFFSMPGGWGQILCELCKESIGQKECILPFYPLAFYKIEPFTIFSGY